MTDYDNEDTIASTENFEAWVSEEEGDEVIFHIETGRVTLHFFQEEWEEFLQLMSDVIESDDTP